MKIMRRARRLFRRDSMEHAHPRRRGTLMPTIGQMERIQRGERARVFHAKVSRTNHCNLAAPNYYYYYMKLHTSVLKFW